MRGAIGTHTGAEVQMIRAAQHNRCAYCDAPLGTSYHVDHIVPLSRGGSNDRVNLCCACPSCNLQKGAKTGSEFLRKLVSITS